MLKRSAAANVAFAQSAAGTSRKSATIMRLLGLVGLRLCAERPARAFGWRAAASGAGTCLAREPDILFLDEPTASLDPAQTKAVEDIIAAVAADGVKVVMATHDRGQARRLAGDMVFLVRGQVLEQTPAPPFFEQPRTYAACRFLAGDLVL